MRQRRTVTCRVPLWSALLALMVAACSSSAGPAQVPEGYRAHEDDAHVTFAVPDHFERTPAGEELIDGLEVEFLDDPSGEQPLPEQITLRHDVPDSQSFKLTAWPGFAFEPVVGNDTSLGREEFEVEGAREALRVDFLRHYDQVDEPVRETGLGVLVDGPDGLVIADLRYIAVESEYDEEIADTLMATLRVR